MTTPTLGEPLLSTYTSYYIHTLVAKNDKIQDEQTYDSTGPLSKDESIALRSSN